ncbi:anks1b [Symbiodinium pilosum]|uniref:Anks1b protein n=1 Tax=Symbiodinium pilosum TaxID=2952 RepID=A0A812ULP1_SYMPI|nr:anks1b [Symbiodinium pilosum]
MSLPWPDPGFVVTRVANLTERSVTVKQLRQLALFLQRLCKALLLKHSTEHSKDIGCYDEYITWFDINMYDITSEVIKKVIPYVDPQIEGAQHAQIEQEWCSWSEFVAPKPQPAKLMISHWWGGRFRDFMRVIQELCVDEALPGSTPLWVCTFANNQWGEDFGDRLADCPFYRTVAAADMTVLIVDRSAGSLGRVWCGLELYQTIRSQKRLLIYTPSGLVGHSSGRASSGPLIEAIKAWDIRQTDASEDAYRRQILNYIAGVDEFEGLELVADGSLARDHGRPLLEDEELEDQALRSSGALEYKHEACLFKDHSKVFEDLNMMVRVEVYATVGRSYILRGCHVPRKEHRGVKLGQWRAFTRQAEADWHQRRWTPASGKLDSFAPASFGDVDLRMVYNLFVKPRVSAATRSYMEMVSDGPQLPKYYVSISWDTRIADAAAAIDWWAEALHLPDSTVLFVDFLSVGPGSEGTKGDEQKEHVKGVAFPAADELLECQALLGVLGHDAPEMASAWRFLEFEFASRNGLDIYMACATGALACSCPFADGSWVFGRFDADIGRSMQHVSSRNCKAKAGDLQAIKEYFESRGHGQAIYDQIDWRFQRWGAGPVLREAAESDDDEEVKAICMNPSLVINGSSLQGAHNETALHIAAAAGSMEAMRALLRLHADPNAQDQLGETPLHYAALAGQSAAAALLLEAKANILCENALAQDPLFVAQQNPAGFLGISMSSFAGFPLQLSGLGT